MAEPVLVDLLVMFPWILGTILLVYEWNVDRNIAGREQTTQGVITTHEPENHNRFGYVFTVNGKSFNGWESSGKDGLEIGHPVLVYYHPLNPNKNALTEFGDKGLSSLGPVPMMLFGIGAVAWYIRTKRRKIEPVSNRAAGQLVNNVSALSEATPSG